MIVMRSVSVDGMCISIRSQIEEESDKKRRALLSCSTQHLSGPAFNSLTTSAKNATHLAHKIGIDPSSTQRLESQALCRISGLCDEMLEFSVENS